MSPSLRFAGLALFVFALTGCPKESEPADHGDNPEVLADDAAEVSELEADVGSLAISLLGDPNVDGVATLAMEEALAQSFLPTGCLTVTHDEAAQRATYAFAACTGPYALRSLTGSIAVGYAEESPTMEVVSLFTQGFKINGATVDWSMKVSVVVGTDGARTMTSSGSMFGATARARTLSFGNEKVFAWTVGGDCVSVEGSSMGRVAVQEVEIDVANFRKCGRACPEAGSAVSMRLLSNDALVSVTYGTDSATRTKPGGEASTFTPVCASR